MSNSNKLLKSLSGVLLGALLLNCSVLFLIINSQNFHTDHQRALSTMEEKEINRFDDPVTAYQILERLDIFEQIPVTGEELNMKFTSAYLGLIPDNDYCKKHRAFMVTHPEVIFTQQNIITSLFHGSLLRWKVIPEMGTDIMPKIGSGMRKEFRSKSFYDLRVDVNNFFTSFALYDTRALGTQYSCLSQSSNAIPGHETLSRRDYFFEGLLAYAESFKSRPQCYGLNIPETYILEHEQACKDFFKMFKSKAYQDLKKERGGIVYISKIGVNVPQNYGAARIDEKREDEILKLYQGGKLCGQYKASNFIQYFVYNPLLLYGHKFEFSIYMLIASANPVISYYYDGFLRLFDPEDIQKNQEGKELYANANNRTYRNLTDAERSNFYFWNLQRLENHLYDNKIVSDRNWLDNSLRPEFKRTLIHLVRMSQGSFKKLSSVYHLFSLNFMLDANLNLWFIDAYASPDLQGFPSEMETHIIKMLKDHYEIIYGLLRSRMKRVVQYVNRIVREGQVFKGNTGETFIIDLEKKTREFQRITRNYFEDEFLPSPENKFQPIINENYEGEQRYFGLIKEECLVEKKRL